MLATRLGKFRQLVDWNPRLAADLAKELFQLTGDLDVLAEVFKGLSVVDPSGVGRRLRGLPKEVGRPLAKALVESVVKENPWAIGELVTSADATTWAKRVQEDAVREWCKHDPEAAADWMASLDDEAMMKRLAKASVSHFQIYSEVGGGWEIFLKSFGHLDVFEGLDPRYRDGGMVSAQTWDEAETFLQSLPQESAKAAYLASFIGSRALRDAAESRRLFDENVPDSMKASVARLLGTRLASGGDVAWDWMRERSDYFGPDAQADFLFSDAFDLRDREATRTKATELLASVEPGEEVPDRVMESVRVMSIIGAMHDFEATVDWVKAIGQDKVREQAFIAMASRLQDGDPSITSEIIAEISPGEKRDGLIKGLVGEIQEDPERAFQWASVVTAPALREQLARKVLDQYWEASPEMLERTINDSALSDGEKERLRESYVSREEQP